MFTVQDAAQILPIDTTYVNDLVVSGSSITTSTTTSVGYDLLVDHVVGAIITTHTFGAGQTQTYYTGSSAVLGEDSTSYKAATSTPGTESMSRSFSPNDNNDDLVLVAIKPAGSSGGAGTTTTNTYTYAGTGYANPHAPTQIADGHSTSTFSYDNSGNLTQKTTDGITTTYLWDYANRLTALGVGGATTTFGYDYLGNRVSQITGTTTTLYPFKWFSVASSTGTGAKYSTTTEYVFNGDQLVSTVDQQMAGGAATGTPATRYIHPDHLGSTNVVTDASGTVVQTLDYFPYGATRISTGQSATSRQYIGQFTDPSNLSYLNARYYDNSRGQFLSEDPVFLGEPKAQNLENPQGLNSYSYANDNPITGKDPSGRYFEFSGSLVIPWRSFSTGIRFDENGIDWFMAGGVGYGLSAGLEAAWAPGESLSHVRESSINVSGQFAEGVGARIPTKC
jgi:RHS repeat-associated protein